jgi:hypothetical protein
MISSASSYEAERVDRILTTSHSFWNCITWSSAGEGCQLVQVRTFLLPSLSLLLPFRQTHVVENRLQILLIRTLILPFALCLFRLLLGDLCSLLRDLCCLCCCFRLSLGLGWGFLFPVAEEKLFSW